MNFNRKALFDGLRADFGKFDDVQVTVISAIVDEFERRKLNDVRWLAYMLATAKHEGNWKSVRETGRGKGKPYGKPINGQTYYGRGLVQLTWHNNYVVMGERLKIDLVNHPDDALIVPVAVKIMFIGMLDGLFTGKELSDYFNATTDDPKEARRIINGADKAALIAGYHAKILAVLKQARLPDAPAVVPTEVYPLPPDVEPAPGPTLDDVLNNAADVAHPLVFILFGLAALIGIVLLVAAST
jgi:hypothetical protein